MSRSYGKDEIMRDLDMLWRQYPESQLGELIVDLLMENCWSATNLWHIDDDEMGRMLAEAVKKKGAAL